MALLSWRAGRAKETRAAPLRAPFKAETYDAPQACSCWARRDRALRQPSSGHPATVPDQTGGSLNEPLQNLHTQTSRGACQAKLLNIPAGSCCRSAFCVGVSAIWRLSAGSCAASRSASAAQRRATARRAPRPARACRCCPSALPRRAAGQRAQQPRRHLSRAARYPRAP